MEPIILRRQRAQKRHQFLSQCAIAKRPARAGKSRSQTGPVTPLARLDEAISPFRAQQRLRLVQARLPLGLPLCDQLIRQRLRSASYRSTRRSSPGRQPTGARVHGPLSGIPALALKGIGLSRVRIVAVTSAAYFASSILPFGAMLWHRHESPPGRAAIHESHGPTTKATR